MHSTIEGYEAESDKKFTQKALSLLLGSREIFSSEYFLAAIAGPGAASPISRDQLLSLCNNLVVLDSCLNVFRFCHLSAREFLEGHDSSGIVSANAVVAELRLGHLMRVSDSASYHSHIVSYAWRFWGIHTKAGSTKQTTEALKCAPASPFSVWAVLVDDGPQDQILPEQYLEQYRIVLPHSLSLALIGFSFFVVSGHLLWDHMERIGQPYLEYCNFALVIVGQLVLPNLLAFLFYIPLVRTNPPQQKRAHHGIATRVFLSCRYVLRIALGSNPFFTRFLAVLLRILTYRLLERDDGWLYLRFLTNRALWTVATPFVLGMMIRVDLGQLSEFDAKSFSLYLLRATYIAIPGFLGFMERNCAQVKSPPGLSKSILLTICAYDLSNLLTIEY